MFGDLVADDSDDRDEVAGDVIELLLLCIGFKLTSLFGRHLGNRMEIFSFKLDDESNFCALALMELPQMLWLADAAATADLLSDVDDGVLLSSEIVVLTIF